MTVGSRRERERERERMGQTCQMPWRRCVCVRERERERAEIVDWAVCYKSWMVVMLMVIIPKGSYGFARPSVQLYRIWEELQEASKQQSQQVPLYIHALRGLQIN